MTKGFAIGDYRMNLKKRDLNSSYYGMPYEIYKAEANYNYRDYASLFINFNILYYIL